MKVVSKRSSFGFTCQLATALFRIIPPRPILRYFTNDHIITEKGRPTYGILTMHLNRMTYKSGFSFVSLSEVAQSPIGKGDESSCSTSWDRTFMNGLLTPNLGYLISPSKKRQIEGR